MPHRDKLTGNSFCWRQHPVLKYSQVSLRFLVVALLTNNSCLLDRRRSNYSDVHCLCMKIHSYKNLASLPSQQPRREKCVFSLFTSSIFCLSSVTFSVFVITFIPFVPSFFVWWIWAWNTQHPAHERKEQSDWPLSFFNHKMCWKTSRLYNLKARTANKFMQQRHFARVLTCISHPHVSFWVLFAGGGVGYGTGHFATVSMPSWVSPDMPPPTPREQNLQTHTTVIPLSMLNPNKLGPPPLFFRKCLEATRHFFARASDIACKQQMSHLKWNFFRRFSFEVGISLISTDNISLCCHISQTFFHFVAALQWKDTKLSVKITVWCCV